MGQFILSAFGDEAADDLETQMDILEQHGIRHIEMRGVNGKPLVHHTEEEVAGIKKALDKKGFKISAIGSPIGKINIGDDFGPHLDLFRHVLRLADILETRYIRMFSFYMPKGEDPRQYRHAVMKRWTRFVETADGSGKILLHENEKEIYGDIPERCLDLFETLRCDDVKAVFDPANFIQCKVRPYPDAFEMLNSRIAYLHIKDALYPDGRVVPAGFGDGRIRETLQALKNRGFNGFISLEPHLGSFAGSAELEKGGETAALPGSGESTFSVAVRALKNILKEIWPQGDF